jgi:hypothetical protein
LSVFRDVVSLGFLGAKVQLKESHFVILGLLFSHIDKYLWAINQNADVAGISSMLCKSKIKLIKK